MNAVWRWPLAVLALLFGAAPDVSHAQALTRDWSFVVYLDDKPIGTHRFVVSGPTEMTRVQSRADFHVTLLGISVYRYQHQADETWQHDCLVTLRSQTQDGSERHDVNLSAAQLAPCTMSFAYWNPRMLSQTRLLNAQTGVVESVRIEQIGRATLLVRGQVRDTNHWRIVGSKQPIDLWYDADTQQWLALATRVSGQRQLRYQLQ